MWMILILAICALLTISMFSIGLKLASGQELSTSVFFKPTNQPKHTACKKTMENSFTVRVLYPLSQRIFSKVELFLPLSGRSWVSQNLTRAGLRKPNYPGIFMGGQVLLALLAPLYGGIMIFTLFRLPLSTTLVVCAVFSLIGFFLPVLWLSQAVKTRKAKVWKALPDFLDLLVISVEAGLGLDAAIQKIAENEVGKRAKELRDELALYLQEVSLGKPRNMALKDFADRIGLDDLNLLIHALVQAFEMGNSVAQTLRVQSEIMRTRRMQTAEEKAAKIPVKMIPPIYVFLFPAIFLSILGPLAITAIQCVMSIMQGSSLK